ncbi:MAG: transketolase [Clostridia bacterium]|nr:transketolase [Clostridia bacterium]
MGTETRDACDLKRMANLLRRDIVEMIGPDNRGHYGGALSCAEILAVLYFYKMRIDSKNPKWVCRDRFIMSKGHAVLTQYAALAERGFFPREELKTLKNLGSRLQGHPDMCKLGCLEANTGSLGQGLSVGNGIATGLKMDGNPANVYVLLGDGELNEGQVWEAAQFAAHYKLDRVVALIDHNGIQATGPIRERMDTGSILEKFRAFGWAVSEVDGHDTEAIKKVLDSCDNGPALPKAIIADTVKGKGLRIAENKAAYHNNALSAAEYRCAIDELSRLVRR